MERYRNLGGDSGVVAYELGGNSITVEFRGGPSCLDSMFHSLSGASRFSDYAAVSRVVRFSQ